MPIKVSQFKVIFACPVQIHGHLTRVPPERIFRQKEVTFGELFPLRTLIQKFYSLRRFDTKLSPEDIDPKHWMVFLNKKRVYDEDPLFRLHERLSSISTLDFVFKPENAAQALALIGATKMKDYFTQAQRSEEIAARAKTKQEIEAGQGPKKKSEPVTMAFLEKQHNNRSAIVNFLQKERKKEARALQRYVRKIDHQAPLHACPVLPSKEQERLDGLYDKMLKKAGYGRKKSNLRTRASTKPVGELTQEDEQRFAWVCQPLPDELTDSKLKRSASSLQNIIDKISTKKEYVPFGGLSFSWSEEQWKFLDPEFFKRLARNPFMRVQHLSNALERCQAYREPTCPTSFGFFQKQWGLYIVTCQQHSCPFKLFAKVELSGVCHLTLSSESRAWHCAKAHPSFPAVTKYLYLVKRKEKGLPPKIDSPSPIAPPISGKQRDQDHSQTSPVKSAISKTTILSKHPMPSQQQASPAQFSAVSPGFADVSPGKKRMIKLADKESPSKFSYVGSSVSMSLRHGRPQAAANKQIDELVLPSLPKALKVPRRRKYQPPQPRIYEPGFFKRSKPAPKVQSKKSVQTQQPPRQEQSSSFPLIPSRREARKAQVVDHLKSRLCPEKSCLAHRKKIVDQLERWYSRPNVHTYQGIKLFCDSKEIGPKFFDFVAFEGVLLNGRLSVFHLLQDLNFLHDFKYETLKQGTDTYVVCAKKPECKFKILLQYEHEAFWIKEIVEATHTLAAHQDTREVMEGIWTMKRVHIKKK